MSGPLNRVVILNDASVGRGGATGLSLELARLLAAQGHDVAYLCGDAGDEGALEAHGVEVFAMGGLHIMQQGRARAAINGIYNPQTVRFVQDWLRDHGRNDDVFHLHGWSKIFSPSIFRALKPVQDRLLVHAHDYFLTCPNGAFWHYQDEQVCTRKALSADCLAQNCDQRSKFQKVWRVGRHATRQTLFSFGPSGPLVVLIHPGMKDAFVRAGFADQTLRVVRNPATPFLPGTARPWEKDALLFAGRLNPEKGALDLARAAQRAERPLMLAGEGPETEAIRAAYPEARLLGWQDRQGIAGLVEQARALVMPSRYPEPFGLVAAEAVGSGLPVILPDTALLAPEIVAAGAGISFAGTPAGGLDRAIAELFDPATDIAAMSKAARQSFGSLANTPSDWVDGMVALYSERLAMAGSAAA
jgi:glycosyltransferase involved in cell wall biosynthesis